MLTSPRAALVTLKKRGEFLAAADSSRTQGRKWVAPGFILQVWPRPEGMAETGDALRVGFTSSRKVGNAVIRNRCRRRLRALAREVMAMHAVTRCAFVLIARPETATLDYAPMRADLEKALKRLKLWRE